ncbi:MULTISPECIES: class I mannose-6-phosphate isomerase [Streptomyces]|uniref:class I mannose-6-phosphate isomerase n=1 Tax=Streptomyces lycopersici TaxID=2974589 RepID=UPI0021D20B3B|nr:class I mannose-6-phosphate isomerase [Streptomyces sp. NEAU-383]
MGESPQVKVKAPQYDPTPCYPVLADAVAVGWADAAGTLPKGTRVLAVDGPAVLDWAAVAAGLGAAFGDGGIRVEFADVRTAVRDWETVRRLTDSDELRGDPDFARLAGGDLSDLMDPRALAALADPDGSGAAEGGAGESGAGESGAGGSGPAGGGALRVLLGPGAALADADVLWWADLPKRYAEAAVKHGRGRNLAAPEDEPPTLRRLLYIDWPLLDRHRDHMAERIDRWIDVTDTVAPTSIGGQALRETCRSLATRPFRTRPTFNSTPWGGHWAQETLGHNPDAENTALGYELIAPESGVLLGDDPSRCVEVPFQLVVALSPVDVLGPAVHEMFGTSFPVRFDYLDTVRGGNLSVHCHPRPDDMRDVFGWPYTQHETYYLMHTGEHSKVFLGLRDGADVEAFHHSAHAADAHGTPFDIERYVQVFPAEAGQLYLVPAGTPHGSGEGNVVLEVSATPYLYSLRFYDWLRRDPADRQRAVHVEHAFRNLDPARSGAAVARELIQRPRPLRAGDGWREEVLGALPAMFFQVHRIVVEPGRTAEQRTDGRFHVLTVVDGQGAVITTAAGHRHSVHYAETLAVPASATAYHVHAQGPEPVRLVKAQVV